jgi:hypothetical protein
LLKNTLVNLKKQNDPIEIVFENAAKWRWDFQKPAFGQNL